jgi:hypothetical protein
MLAENTAESANADSERIEQGIIQQSGDCKNHPSGFVKCPDKLSV